MAANPAPVLYTGWSYSFFNYGDNCGKCICALCFPGCAAARARTIYDNSSCLFNYCCLTPCAVRNIIREGYGIMGDCMEDLCFTCAFPACAIAQAWAETERRGGLSKATTTNWTRGLGSCCDYPGQCIYACICPACAAASERSNFDRSNWCFNLFTVQPCAARNIVREGYNINGGCCGDILVMWCCTPCGLVQMHREIETRGQVSRNLAGGTNPPQPKQMY